MWNRSWTLNLRKTVHWNGWVIKMGTKTNKLHSYLNTPQSTQCTPNMLVSTCTCTWMIYSLTSSNINGQLCFSVYHVPLDIRCCCTKLAIKITDNMHKTIIVERPGPMIFIEIVLNVDFGKCSWQSRGCANTWLANDSKIMPRKVIIDWKLENQCLCCCTQVCITLKKKENMKAQKLTKLRRDA